MKKILITFSLMATLIAMSCNTTKNSVATAAPPPPPSQTPEKPVKGEMKESEIKIATPQYEKKKLPQKSNRLQPLETAAMVPDTIR